MTSPGRDRMPSGIGGYSAWHNLASWIYIKRRLYERHPFKSLMGCRLQNHAKRRICYIGGGWVLSPFSPFTRREERQISSWSREPVWEYVPNRGAMLVSAVTTNC